MRIVNRLPYVRVEREFPSDTHQLTVELNKMHIEDASAINDRTIGLYPANAAAVTGNKWFLEGQPQQTLRQIYAFTDTTSINHGISFSEIDRFVQMYGTYTDGTNWYSLVPGSSTAIAAQIGFYLDPTQIVFTSGGGAPTLTRGSIVLEWLSLM